MSAKTIKLSAAIVAHGETVEKLSIRKPQGGDVMDLGVPFVAAENGVALPNMAVMGKYISKLGNIPLSSVRAMEVGDLMLAADAVAGFFGETMSRDEPSS